VSDAERSGVLRAALTVQFGTPLGDVVSHYRVTWCPKDACAGACAGCALALQREVTFLEGNDAASGKVPPPLVLSGHAASLTPY